MGGSRTETWSEVPTISSGYGRINVNINVNSEEASSHRLRDLIDTARGAMEHAPASSMPELVPHDPRFEIWQMPNVYDENDIDWDIRMKISPTAMSLLFSRMKWGAFSDSAQQQMVNEASIPFQHISVHQGVATVFVFVVSDGKSVTLEDSPDLYPSDQLITQLRLMAKDQTPKT